MSLRVAASKLLSRSYSFRSRTMAGTSPGGALSAVGTSAGGALSAVGTSAEGALSVADAFAAAMACFCAAICFFSFITAGCAPEYIDDALIRSVSNQCTIFHCVLTFDCSCSGSVGRTSRLQTGDAASCSPFSLLTSRSRNLVVSAALLVRILAS